ncbi:DeoR/GlpR family DNA-binding transcription regulator [Corynebacterium sp. H127]|uniref:DeoR/GlpR family DNA-binding transcription regulator n=1 Tax=Corynebacterium sp. H127 TaxID=3133418 RepID=UPI0030DAFC7A
MQKNEATMLSAPERQAEISHTTKTTGHVSVSQLATHFGVTPETIRRDLKSLESRGRLVRVHGGAVSTTASSGVEVEYGSNALVNMEQKRRIALAAWNRISAETSISSLSIDAGTTTLEFAREMASASQLHGIAPLTAITNSIPVANLTAEFGLTNVHVVGGRIRPITRAIVGDHTVLEIERLRTDFAVMGTNGLSSDHGCSTPDPSEAAVKSAMIKGARNVMVLCDSTKLQKDYLVTFGTLEDINIVVTDSGIDPDHRDRLESIGIEVVVS